MGAWPAPVTAGAVAAREKSVCRETLVDPEEEEEEEEGGGRWSGCSNSFRTIESPGATPAEAAREGG